MSTRAASICCCFAAVALAAAPPAAWTAPAGGGDRGGADDFTISELLDLSGEEFDNKKLDYDILRKAAIAANLKDTTFADTSLDFTFFAPNDLAWWKLAKELGYTGGYDEQKIWQFVRDELASLLGEDKDTAIWNVLLYHTSGDSWTVGEIFLLTIFEIPIETLHGEEIEPLFLRLNDADPDLKDPRITLISNINARNGVVHTINRVLIPVNLAD